VSSEGRVSVGHPVDVASGSVFTMVDDFVLSGTLGLFWTRYYSTDLQIDGPLGRGWTVQWLMSLRRIDVGYEFTDENGRSLVFPLPEKQERAGARVMNYGANVELVMHADRIEVNHWHHGGDGIERYIFSPSGSELKPLAWVENLLGHRITVEHDADGRPVRLRQELEERTIEISYRNDGLIGSLAMVGDDGRRQPLVDYDYDEHRRLLVARDALQQPTSYAYDDRGRMSRETNKLGSSFHFRYDDAGRCVHSFGDGGYLERRLRYQQAPRATRVTDSLGNTTLYVLNTAGQVIQEVSPRGATTTTEYDDFGRTTAITSAMGVRVQYEYDERGDRCCVVHPDGLSSRMTFNEQHVLRTYTSPSGSTWTCVFGSRGEPVGAINALGQRRSYQRDTRGLVTETRFPSGRSLKRRYGPRLRFIETFDQLSVVERTEYDEAGNNTAILDAIGAVQRIEYDALGRPVAASDRSGRSFRLAWNALGELVELIGNHTAWERRHYDGFGQLIRHENPIGTLSVQYDSEGRITKVINRGGEGLTWTYDADGWLISETGFDGREEHYEYDLSGRATRRIFADGRSIARAFAASGNVSRCENSSGEIEEFGYDVDWRLIEAKNAWSDVKLERDALGRVVAEIQNGRRIEYYHDTDGNRIGRRVGHAGNRGIRLELDSRCRVNTVEDDSGVCLTLRWDELNRLVHKRFAESVTEQLTVEPVDRLAIQTVSSGAGGTLVERVYRFDVAGNLHEQQEWRGGRFRFRHDEIGRLTGVLRDDAIVEHYFYDANGAILATHRGEREVGVGGCNLSDGTARYLYGADGAISRIDAVNGTSVLEHNVDGQVTAVRFPDGRTATYEYDPLGRRTAKVLDGSRTEFLWDGPLLAAEIDAQGTICDYWSLGSRPALQWNAGRRLLPVTDLSGLVREMLSPEGRVLWQARYEAFGRLVDATGEVASPFRFLGQYFDNETGFHHNFWRSYLPGLGDFTARDPIGIEGGLNTYAYPRNPLQWTDRFGLKCGQGPCGEKSMDGFFSQKGYRKISMKKDAKATGIDAIYYKRGGRPPYIIAEAKNGGGDLILTGPNHDIWQTSNAWINSPSGNASQSRLDAAFPPGSPWPDRIRSSSQNDGVARAVFHADQDPSDGPKVTNYGPYDSNSAAKSPPPQTPDDWSWADRNK
jgi:RHS repeat-associated protein